jgi:hypothetical protein
VVFYILFEGIHVVVVVVCWPKVDSYWSEHASCLYAGFLPIAYVAIIKGIPKNSKCEVNFGPNPVSEFDMLTSG